MKKKLLTILMLAVMLVGSAWGQTLLIENFDYTIGTNLTDVGWTAHSGGGTQPIDVTNGLTYTGYLGSGIGGAANLDNNGEDDNKSFTIQNSGTMYYAFLINVNVGTAGYFLHFIKSGTTYASRIYVKPSSTFGKINFGISNTGTASYAASATDFDPDVTYLLIVKYDVSSTGAGSLWVIPSGVPSTEVLAGIPEHTTTGSGQTGITAIALRQYIASQRIVVDGIRVGNTWSDITGTTWTGTSDHDWATAGNWTNNLPDANVDVLIPTGASNYPTISAAATCNDITIEDGASLVGAENLTVSGTFTMQRTITNNNGWHLLSSPVSSMTIVGSDFVPTPTLGVLPTTFDFYSFLESETALPWINIRAAGNTLNGTFETQFQQGKGYLVAYSASYGTTTFNFQGTKNSGTIVSPSLTYTESANKGANLIGNPYPSAINWSLATRTQFADNFAYIYNESKSGGAGYEAITGLIAPNQGFVVLLNSGNTGETFSFTTGLQDHGGSFLKESETLDKLTLRLGNGVNYDEVDIVKDVISTFERDRNDAVKFFSFNTNIPQVYSATQDEVSVAINSIPEISEEAIIPINLYVPVEGNYYLSLSGVVGSFENHKVFLDDLISGNQIEISNISSYEFTAAPSDVAKRFLVHFGPLGINESADFNQISAYVYNNNLYVQNNMGDAQVSLYDIQGRQMYTEHLNNGGLHKTVLNLPTGIYIVRLQSNNQVKNVKVFIN